MSYRTFFVYFFMCLYLIPLYSNVKLLFLLGAACQLCRATLIFLQMSMFQKLVQTRGVKQKWLAQQLGVSEVTVSNWMRGHTRPTDENLNKISKVLNMDVELLKDALNEL